MPWLARMSLAISTASSSTMPGLQRAAISWIAARVTSRTASIFSDVNAAPTFSRSVRSITSVTAMIIAPFVEGSFAGVYFKSVQFGGERYLAGEPLVRARLQMGEKAKLPFAGGGQPPRPVGGKR